MVLRIRIIFISRASVFLFEDAHGIFQLSLYHEGAVIPVLLQQKSNYIIIRNLDESSHKIRIEATDTKSSTIIFLSYQRKSNEKQQE
jgi:hypothetical protein